MKQDSISSILEFLRKKPESSSSEIYYGVNSIMSYASVKRLLSRLLEENSIIAVGKGRGTKYKISLNYTTGSSLQT
jgi:predicted transcriptional regulator